MGFMLLILSFLCLFILIILCLCLYIFSFFIFCLSTCILIYDFLSHLDISSVFLKTQKHNHMLCYNRKNYYTFTHFCVFCVFNKDKTIYSNRWIFQFFFALTVVSWTSHSSSKNNLIMML